MAASYRHRKLMENPTTNSTFAFPSCILECDSQLNLTGICSAKCIFYCPSFCRTAESAPPPSSSPPAASPYALPSPPDHHHHRYPHPLSLPLKISLIFIISTFIYTIYKFYTVWRRRRTPPPTSPENLETHDHDHIDMVDHPIWYIRTTGLQPSVINAITVTKFNKADRVIDGTDCSVCLSEFEEDDTLRLLPNCKHAFHISCIDTWLRSHTNCPLCRAGIVNNAADVPSQELTTVDLGFSSFGDFNRGEAGESSELRIGETDEEYQIGSSDVAASDHDRIGSVDGEMGIELVKSGQTTDNNSPKREG